MDENLDELAQAGGTETQDHQAIFDRLNRDFYRADPADYFHTRWLSLVLLAGRPDDVLALLRDGATHGHVHVRIEGSEIDVNGVRDHVTMDSQVLLHQASEALLRLYLAHAARPLCPWMEVAGETSFGRFKERVRKEILGGDIRADVKFVFLGVQPPDGHPHDAEAWSGAADNLASFLRVLARRWLEEAHAYNALKHGLAVLPSSMRLQFIAETGTLEEARVLGDGPSLDYLECSAWEGNERDGSRREWKRTTTWIDVSESLAFTSVARSMIGSLWTIARARYTGTELAGDIFFPQNLTPSSLRSPDRAPGRSWSMKVGLDEVRPPKPRP